MSSTLRFCIALYVDVRAIPEITERGGRAAIEFFLDGWSYFLYWLFVYGWVSKKLFFMGGWSFVFALT